jgi:hypothetical protein
MYFLECNGAPVVVVPQIENHIYKCENRTSKLAHYVIFEAIWLDKGEKRDV